MSCVRSSIVDFKKAHFTPALMRGLFLMLETMRPERTVLLGIGEALCSPRVRPLIAALRRLETMIVLVTNTAFLTPVMSSFLLGLPLDEIYVSWDDDIGGSGAVIRPGMRASDFRSNVEALAGMKTASRGDNGRSSASKRSPSGAAIASSPGPSNTAARSASRPSWSPTSTPFREQ
ncbi:MAG TPA: hypothetical protein PKX40_03105 [Spirochaetota bacterium]|nr:hypothetical protein [Spirochaetota bacterium]